ncbi:LysR family transcriptional regulator [Mesorhizobium sp. SP-1A]|uniref:LysR family transcriptional regulator n=1 Tax=Mesorhizobium sp. SP-1A TaxID=3077840 RepID=UPI0028F7093F|nr:LysR family transcriptional regulator [Mesorhizobium sp. SP-1A]
MLNQLSASDMRALNVFACVAEAGSFVGAQEILNISQSTISVQLSTLEARLGYRLCERGRGGFRLTERGHAVLDAFRTLRASIDGFRFRVNDLAENAVGTLRLGILDNVISEPTFRIVDALRLFLSRAPDAKIEIVQGAQQGLRDAILDDQLDLAIGCFDTQNLAIRDMALHLERQYAYCGSGHPLFDLPPQAITQRQIEESDWVQRGYFLGRGDRYGFDVVRSTAIAASIEAVAMLILAGRHVGFLPNHYAQPYETAGRMRRLSPDTLVVDRPFSIISRFERHDTPVMAVFRECLDEVASQDAQAAAAAS